MDDPSMIKQVESRKIKFTPSVLIEEIDQDGNQCGFAAVEPWGVYLFLRLLFVHRDKRHEGVAKRLIDQAKKYASGYRGLALQPESWADEPMRLAALREWYRREGFQPSLDVDGVFIWTSNDQE
jgi:GNAT superfamily N-acetyltransferase